MTTAREHWASEDVRQGHAPRLDRPAKEHPMWASWQSSQQTHGLGRDNPPPRKPRPWLAWALVALGVAAVVGPLVWGWWR